MGYVTIKENTSDRLCLCREPNVWSWSILCAAFGIGLGAAIYGTDSFFWKFLYVAASLYGGLLWMEGWEDCELDKQTGELKITRKNVFQRLLPSLAELKIVVVNLDDIVGVRVDEEDVRYFGKSHSIVFLLNTGMTIGVTEAGTFGNSQDHYEVAETLRSFLELDNPAHHHVQDTDDYLGDGSSSDDSSFEEIDGVDVEGEPESPPPPPPQ